MNGTTHQLSSSLLQTSNLTVVFRLENLDVRNNDPSSPSLLSVSTFNLCKGRYSREVSDHLPLLLSSLLFYLTPLTVETGRNPLRKRIWLKTCRNTYFLSTRLYKTLGKGDKFFTPLVTKSLLIVFGSLKTYNLDACSTNLFLTFYLDDKHTVVLCRSLR